MTLDERTNLDSDDRQHLNQLDVRLARFGWGTAIVGLAVVAVATMFTAEDRLGRFAHAYLSAFMYVLSLLLGCLLFVMLTHLYRAGWSIVVRRVAEVFAATMPALAILSLPILVIVLLSDGRLYPWAFNLDDHGSAHASMDVPIWVVASGAENAHGGTHSEVGKHILEAQSLHLSENKRRYWLNIPWFIVRWVGIVVIWCAMALWYWKTSLRQDKSSDPGLTRKMEKFSAPGTLIFAVTITIVAFDLLMSLEPEWFSTIFGVYYFAGSMIGCFSILILALMGLQRLGHVPSVTVEHYHDLGKLLFAFVVFWAYIAYSQYMLIWYATLPTETFWMDKHGLSTNADNSSAFGWVGLVFLFGHFLIPFLGLMSRHVKRCKPALAFWAVWMLIMHWIDLWWIVLPSFEETQWFVPTVELGCLLLIGGVCFAVAVRLAADRNLVPVGDPRLAESVRFENF